jgi:succinoglycan biosynthesis transport protein ExoP
LENHPAANTPYANPQYDHTPYDMQQHEEEPFPLLDYLQLLWFRRRLILVITILVSVIGYIQVNQLRNIYSASSSILIGIQQASVSDFNSYMARYYNNMEPTEEVEILKSRGLAEKVISNLQLLNQAEFNPLLAVPETGLFNFLRYLNPLTWIPDNLSTLFSEARSGEVVLVEPTEEEIERRKMVTAVDIFLGMLSATSVQYSDVITVSFSSYDPKLAMRIANEIPEAYIVGQLEAKFEATQKVTNWLTGQLEELKTKVADSEQAVEMYRQEHGLSERDGTGLLAKQLSETNSQLIIARVERAEAEARLAQMNRLLDNNRQGLDTSAEVLASSLIQQIRNQEAEARRRKSELAVEYGPKHPRMLQLNAEIEDLERRVVAEMDKITIALENKIEMARLRESSMETSLRELEAVSGAQSQEAVQLRALEREAAANRALFENFLGRFKETSSTEGMESADARVLSKAEVPADPSAPNRRRMLMTYVLLGFMGACGLVLGLQFLNPGIYTPEQIEHDLGIQAIGMIPKLPSKVESQEYILDNPHSGFVEAVNSLRVSMKLSDPDNKVKAIQITSAVPEEGKTTLAIDLAMAMIRSGERVILVDADLRRSKLVKRLGLPTNGPGLTDLVMSDSEQVSSFVIHDEKIGIDIMRNGDAKFANATDIFSSQRMQTIIDLLKQQYDYILFDTPPVMAVADARVIGSVVDSTLFVVRWDKTPKKVARATLQLLQQGGADIVGIVLQQVDLKRYGRIGYGDSGYYYHHGRYGQYYSS